MASTDLAIGSLIIGGSVAFVDGFNVKIIKNLIIKYKLSWLVLMPGMLAEFIKYLRGKNINIRGIKVMGAMADLIPKKQITEITTLLNTPYLNSFGSTETGMPPASAGFIKKKSNNFSLSKVQSSFCEVILVNNNKKVLEYGVSGECAIRGPTLFSGYWEAEKINLQDFRNGWFHMGDMMRRNKDGTLDFVDRKKYLIKSGGENIYPAEIERVFLSHKNVSESVVVRIKSKKWGESPIAIISINDLNEKKNTIIDLRKLCRNCLAGYKQPVEILVIEERDIPRSTTGKVQRHLVEEMYKSYFKK
jgi:fatty-acyl-CoA synthase